ncbi:RNA polymerase II-associated protein 1 [Strongylocentrotus purpuratus]|uniref:RNA polymerase II-associated protein 1 n=1 Tax=Strongylocentrotus purpuratus TaxID=7668 RepID=A0A7M7PRQ0_STRPU|nr:RNA polymerase II-associated protein 1 [Strongylocentrotus purpuratus]
MNRRPRAGETEEDLLRLQAQFVKEKPKPSVTIKKADKRKASSSGSNTGSTGSSTSGPSVGATVTKDVVTLPGLPTNLLEAEQALASHPQKRSKFKARQDPNSSRAAPQSHLPGQRVTFNLDDDDEDPEAAMDRQDTHITAVLSKIREQDIRQKPAFLPQPTNKAFPTALHRSQAPKQASGLKTGKKRSLFAQQFDSTPAVDFGVTLGPPPKVVTDEQHCDADVAMETNDSSLPSQSNVKPISGTVPSSSSSSVSYSGILKDSGQMNEGVPNEAAMQTTQDIQTENQSKMAAMSEEEILLEQAKLKAMLDPSLVAFLQARKKGTVQNKNGSNQESPPMSEPVSVISPSTQRVPDNEAGEQMDTGMKEGDVADSLEDKDISDRKADEITSTTEDKNGKVPVDVKSEWLNMKKREDDKLQWMDDLPKPSAKSQTGSQARFDFNGQLVARDALVSVREGLFHHGAEQEVPGYTLEELFTLSRSAVIQQRVLALQTLARLIYNYRADCLGGQLRSPLISRLLKAGVLFLLRWSLDDTNEGVHSAGVEALAALLVQPGDEEALDKTFTWHLGCSVPPMLPRKDAQGDEDEDEDDDLDDDDEEEEEEEEQKQTKPDEHIASQDVIKGLLKMSVLPRLRYILEVVRPTPPVILNILAFLIRMARHSAEAALEVMKCPRLMDTIIREFLPTSSWQKQDDPVSDLYGHPTTLAMKLVRVLCLSGRHIAATLLSKYPLLTIIIRYFSMEPTDMNLNVGEAFHLSIESLKTWSACVRYGLGCDAYRELYPLLMQQLQIFQRLSVLPLPSTVEKTTCLVHRLQLIRATALISLLEGVVQVAGTAAELQGKFAMRNDATNKEAPREAISPPPIDWSHVTGLATPLETCTHRWLVEMTGCTEVLSPEASSLAGSAMDFLATFYSNYTLQASYNPVNSLNQVETFVDGVLLPYMKSSSFYSAVHNLQVHSSLTYRPTNHKRYSTRALPSFSCHSDDSSDETLPCVRKTSTLGYGAALFRLTYQMIKIHKGVAPRFEPIVLSCYVLPYLENFCADGACGSVGLAEHFAVHEHTAVYFLIKIFQCVVQQVDSCKHHSQLYHSAAMKLLARLQPGYEHYAHDLLSMILFSTEFLAEGNVGDPMASDLAEFLTFSDKEPTRKERDMSKGELLQEAYQRLASIRNLYMVYFGKEQPSLARSRARCTGRHHEVTSLNLPPFLGPVLPIDWPFLPLVQIFSEAQKAEMKGKTVKSLPPHIMGAITDTLGWVFILETWRPLTLRSIPLAAKIARLYCIFLTASDLFMEPSIHHYLAALLKIYTSQDYMKDMDFDQEIPGLGSFNDLFNAVLAQYEAVSFGDLLFSHYVLLPLQQRFSIHFRKTLWFDHIDLLRTLPSHPSKCPIPTHNFLDPPERDPSLISMYFQNLVQGKVRPTWCPMMHLVAVHHVANFMFSSGQGKAETVRETTAKLKLIKSTMGLHNEDLKQLLLLYRGPDTTNPNGYTTYESLPEDRSVVLQAAERAIQEQRSKKMDTVKEGQS